MITAKRVISIISLILIFFVSACVSETRQNDPPELLFPVSNRVNTAIVTRGTIEQVTGYPGIIRIDSDRLTFGNTTLRFSEFFVMTGDRVVKGELLARLDTRSLEKQLKNLQRRIENAGLDHKFENDLIKADILILQAELNQLYAAGARTDTIELKRLDITQKELELTHVMARQELIMNEFDARLENLHDQLKKAEIRAPYDGIITWMADVKYLASLYPFQTIICISDEKDMFIEFASVDSLRIHKTPTTVLQAKVKDSIYDLDIRELDEDEASFFLLNRMSAPARFDVLNPDTNFKPGPFVVIANFVNISHDTLIIPVNSVYASPTDRYVYINNNGTKEVRIVETGIRNKAMIEILNGLEEGEEVFVR